VDILIAEYLGLHEIRARAGRGEKIGSFMID
jgi:hypothetical protein